MREKERENGQERTKERERKKQSSVYIIYFYKIYIQIILEESIVTIYDSANTILFS